MEYRKLGSSGLDVSVVGLGTNNFGRRLDYERSERVVRASLDEGVNTIDTSNSYGDSLSEEYIGRALEGRRSEAVIATKVASQRGDGPNMAGASRKHILDQIEGSLRRLRTDHIDLYQIHFPDAATPIDETLRTLDDLVRSGKVRYTGCSNFAGWQLAQAMERAIAVGAEPFASVQPPYSMLQRDIEKELVPCCEAYGVGILPYFPLANGLLTGKYRRGQAAPGGYAPRRRLAQGEADAAGRGLRRAGGAGGLRRRPGPHDGRACNRLAARQPARRLGHSGRHPARPGTGQRQRSGLGPVGRGAAGPRRRTQAGV